MAELSTSSVLIGGSLALGGVVLGHILTFANAAFERAHKNKEILRQKFEEMASLIDDTVLWYPQLDSCTSAEEIRAKHPPQSSRRISLLARIYFPEIAYAAAEYTNGVISYYNWASKCFDGTDRTLAQMMSDDPGYESEFDKVEGLRQDLEDLIQEYAKKYTQT